MGNTLRGKGIWARPRGGATTELEQAIRIAGETGITHILYKVAHGAAYFGGSAQAAQRIAAAGLTPMAWMWLSLYEPEKEAQAIHRAFQDGFQGMVLDTEASSCEGRFAQARTLVTAAIQLGVDREAVYNCSFPNISSHRTLPYDELNELCHGGLMPMSYGTLAYNLFRDRPNDPATWEAQARLVLDDWTYGHYETWCERWGYRPPLYPVLAPYHDEYGNVRMSVAEFQVWLDHLAAHRPSFFSIFTAAVLDAALFPLVRAFPLAEGVGAPHHEEASLPEQAWVGPLEGAILYDAADPRARRLSAWVYATPLSVLGRRTGTDGNPWLQVRTADGSLGWMPANHLALVNPGPPPELPAPPPPPPGQLTHAWTTQEVNYRSEPAVRPDTLIGRLFPGARLRVAENPTLARNKVGRQGQWMRVQVEPNGAHGWAAAWYLTDHDPSGHVAPAPVSYLRVQSAAGLPVRGAPNAAAPVVWRVPDGTVLRVIEDPQTAAAKVGVAGQWVRVETPSLHQGYVAADALRADLPPDDRQPVRDEVLPLGECAYIFGIHGAGATDTADFRHLFQGSGKTGWVLFTEAIGCNPQALGPNEGLRQRLWTWASTGYGVIIRLNNGYTIGGVGPGTIPESAQYEAFAATCARYAELYLKRPAGTLPYTWVIVIGNEQNNVKEHPGGDKHPREHITPQRYARAFNLAYRAIKQVLPNATVVPGAVDPYNTWPWALEGNRRYRPLDYFREMLAEITELDGFALHTYTHGPVVDYITSKRVFTDPPLDPGTEYEHYFDFQAYRPFIEAIPPRWRDRPVYITETNHWVVKADGSPPTGWLNENKGWVRAAYDEIQRWNAAPHAQQIHCLLLYRWQGDEWAIHDKDQVQQDFKQALVKDYRWRR
jgi:hypothetical protein